MRKALEDIAQGRLKLREAARHYNIPESSIVWRFWHQLCGDLKRLNPGQFLNDTIVDFYIKRSQEDKSFTLKEKKKIAFLQYFLLYKSK